jgi:short-subunit dehydrogenase
LTSRALHEVFETNVYGPLRLVRACLPRLRERGGGQILVVSSVLGYRALPGMGGYCATKAALNSLTEALRVELHSEVIDVILIAPGSTATEFRRRAASVSGARGREDRLGPLRTMSAQEVARAMVRASRRRSREVVLTAAGKALVRLQRASPALCDRVAARALDG